MADVMTAAGLATDNVKMLKDDLTNQDRAWVKKPILLVDFDGVIHSYRTGWHGATIIKDPPVPGAIVWLWEATQVFEVNIYSSRSHELGGISAMMSYICAYAVQVFDDPEKAMRLLGELKFPKEKPPAFLTIDDRALTFEGDFTAFSPQSLLQFKPWNKRS